MESQIVIFPKTKPLSATELISLRNIESGSLKVGHKKTAPNGTTGEADELTRVYGELKKQLSAPRIEKLSGRSQGEWDFNRNAVRILRKEGKFKVFGYFLNENHYLEYYEALFLMELNRLEILYHSMRMSIEQAYAVLLGEEHSMKYNIYLVYSMFSRVGYIVQRYQNLVFSTKNPSQEDCIWEILLNSIQSKPITENVRNSEHFLKVEASMKSIRERIMTQVHSKEVASETKPLSFETNFKRKGNMAGPANYKRVRCDFSAPQSQKSFIDFLTKEEEYKKFGSIFQSFDIIKLRPKFDYDKTLACELEIHFDVYQHNMNFKKSEPKVPAFRLAILKNEKIFPNRAEISRCYHSQECQVPILVVSISESKHIQAFLFYFT